MNFRKMSSAVAALAISVGGLALVVPATANAADVADHVAPVGFGGNAFGSQVKIAGPLAHSGKTAYVAIGCTNRTPVTKSNDTLAVDIPTIGHVGAVTTQATTRGNDVSGEWTAKTNASVAGASLLPGLIEIGAVTSQARASYDVDGFHADTKFSIASLSIGGVSIVIDPDGNQVIDVPGVGSLTLGESTVKEKDNSSSAEVDAIVLRITGGTVVRVGHSEAHVNRAVNSAVFKGGAYGSTVEVAGTITSGKTANDPIPCVGTHGNDKVNTVASVDLGGLGDAGAVTSTVNAQQLPLPEAHAKNEIADVSLLAGLVHLQAIKASVNVYEDANGDVTYDTNGTSLGSIKVGIITIPVPPQGGSVVLPGVGTLHFYEVNELAGGRGVEVTAVRIVLLDSTQIVLGHASATIK
jgi:hypothetical protein